MLRKCLLPHCLDFRLVMGLLFGAFAKDLPLVPLCLSHCQSHSRAQLWYPHSSQTLGFLLASKKFIQSYLMHSLSASQGHAIYFFPLYFFAFLSLLLRLLQAFSNCPSLPLVFPALVHPPHRCLNYLLKAHIHLTSLLSGIKSYQCLPTTNRVRSELLSP